MNELKRPFAPDDISWLPGATTKDGGKVQAMAYADLRAYMDRLDEVCGDDWQVSYAPWGDRIICNLTIGNVTRSSTGEMDNQSQKREIGGTVAEAQAFKRACAMFGLGRYLYNLPSVWVEYDAQRKQIADRAKAELEQRYRTWYAKTTQRPATPATAHIDDAPPVSQDGPEENPFHDDSIGASAEPAPRGQPVTKKTLARLHILGNQFYGSKAEWDAKRPGIVEYVSQGAVTSSADLTENEARKLCASLEAKIAKQGAPDAKLRNE